MMIWRKLRDWWSEWREGPPLGHLKIPDMDKPCEGVWDPRRGGQIIFFDKDGQEVDPDEMRRRIEQLETQLQRANQGRIHQRQELRRITRNAEALKRDWPAIYTRYFNNPKRKKS